MGRRLPLLWVLANLAACAGADDSNGPPDLGERARDQRGVTSDGGEPQRDASTTSAGSSGSHAASSGKGGSSSAAGASGGGGSGSSDKAGTGGSAPRGSGSGGSTSAGSGSDQSEPTLGTTVTVHLVPQSGVTGMQRINFAVPLQAGQLADAARVRVLHDGSEVAAAHQGLASYADGSVRSVQLQVELDVSGETDLEVQLDQQPASAALDLVAVVDTLVAANGEQGPKVWAVLPAAWLSASGFAGPLNPEADVAAEPTAAWAKLCDYDEWGTAAFLSSGYETDRAVWLFDRGTALYRGYARRGELATLRDAYRETSMYRNAITGSGKDARNGLPDGGGEDVKYTYSQNMALHYLLSGDDRYRESAEDMALAMSVLWSDPDYAGGDDFWTERHAGFGLLAYVWAMIVSDDRAADFRALADEAVDAYLHIQATYPAGYDDPDARCFAHTANAHGEDGAYFGCSPWMSAIVGDALEQYATESGGERATKVRDSLVKLGRIIAQRGIQPDGRPYYFMGVGTDENMIDEYDEHYGESAYLIAMAWYFSGKNDAQLRSAADALVQKVASDGTVPHVRSFNWQCRSAVAGAWFLR